MSLKAGKTKRFWYEVYGVYEVGKVWMLLSYCNTFLTFHLWWLGILGLDNVYMECEWLLHTGVSMMMSESILNIV